MKISRSGSITYYDDNGMLHNEDGPADEITSGPNKGSKFYYKHGHMHRLDGPAYIYICKNITTYLYFVDGHSYSEEEFNRLTKLKALL